MARVAVVSGGTRGIGAAIGKALQTAGYTVAATYAGNDEAAAKFKAETGIAVYKWDVSNYKACAEGLAKVGHEIGPVDILVNNAGITRDTMFHKMTPEQWLSVITVHLNGSFFVSRAAAELVKQFSSMTGLLKSMIEREHMTPNPRDLSGVLVAGTFEQRQSTVIGTWPMERDFVEALASGQIQ